MEKEDWEKVTEVVEEVLWEYLEHVETPKDVNTGGCFGFAEDVKDALEDEFTAIMLMDTEHMHGFVYVVETDLFYDSTAIEGVEEWNELEFYQEVQTFGFGIVEYIV